MVDYLTTVGSVIRNSSTLALTIGSCSAGVPSMALLYYPVSAQIINVGLVLEVCVSHFSNIC